MRTVTLTRLKVDTTNAPDRNTLKVYWYLLMQRTSKAGIRQVQRAMGFSSPNAAIFHLNKLQDMHLVEHLREGDYEVQQKIHFGEMKSFLRVGSHFIPKHALYAITMTAAMICCTIILFPILSAPMLLALFPGLLAMGILWYEAYLVLQKLPRYHDPET